MMKLLSKCSVLLFAFVTGTLWVFVSIIRMILNCGMGAVGMGA